VRDPIALELRLRVPTNVRGFQFASSFYTHEYPEYLCSSYNDIFVVLQERESGRFENILFDDAGNLMTVNNALLRVCRTIFDLECDLGAGLLARTGYDVSCDGERDRAGASTGCVETISPVNAGSILTLRFADLGLERRDQRLDR
jgi:hypothetical protein